MNKKLINPENYRWVLHIPWRECIILLAISFLGILLHILITIDVVQAIITTLSNNSYQCLLNFSILLFNIGWKGCIAILVAETLCATVQSRKGLRIIKSIKATHHLQQALKNPVDFIPDDNIDKRVTASEISSKLANKALMQSMVIIFDDKAYIFIKLPTEVSIRHNILSNADEVANDVAESLQMRRTAKRSYQNSQNFSKYIYYELHN